MTDTQFIQSILNAKAYFPDETLLYNPFPALGPGYNTLILHAQVWRSCEAQRAPLYKHTASPWQRNRCAKIARPSFPANISDF
jgi:hypothetical protein